MIQPYVKKSGVVVYRARTTDEHGAKVQHTFPTKKLAQEWERRLADRKARSNSGLPIERGPIRYSALVDLYKNAHEIKNVKWRDEMLSYSLVRFGTMYVHLVLPEEIASWINKELARLSAKTRRHILSQMRQALKYGVEWGYITRSPARPEAVPGPSLTAKPPKVLPFQSWAEVRQVADAAPRWSQLIRFACATGLRPEEWAALRWSDVDVRERTVSVLRTVTDGAVVDAGKTPGALRTVALSKPALSALAELTRPIRSDALVFPAAEGGYINLDNWRRRVWHPALIAAKLEPRPLYQMRHTYATLALAEGATLDWISEQMGHTDMRITKRFYARYVKRVDDRMRALLDRMEDDQDETRSHLRR